MFDWLRRIGVVIFSVFFWTTSFAWMLIGAVLSMLLLVVGVPYTRVHMWVTAPIFSRCVGLSFTRLQIEYHPDFKPDVRSIYAQNHINLLDGHVAAAVIPHAFSGLMNAWQFKIPVYGWLMSLSKGIPVRRGRRDETIREISEAAKQRGSIGMSVLTFPEGHRTVDGKLRPFRHGVFMMARNADMPIVPITVRGMYDVNHKGSSLFHPFHTVQVLVGPQVSTEGLSDQDMATTIEQVQGFMAHCLEHGEFPDGAIAAKSRTQEPQTA